MPVCLVKSQLCGCNLQKTRGIFTNGKQQQEQVSTYYSHSIRWFKTAPQQTAVSSGTATHFALAGKRRLAFWPLEMFIRHTIEGHFSMHVRAASESLPSPVKKTACLKLAKAPRGRDKTRCSSFCPGLLLTLNFN